MHARNDCLKKLTILDQTLSSCLAGRLRNSLKIRGICLSSIPLLKFEPSEGICH